MNVRKEVRFTRDEVTKLVEDAVKAAAAALIGLPSENEEMVVEMAFSCYGTSIVTIQTKEEVSK